MGLRGLDGTPSIPLMPCLPLKAGRLAFLRHLPVDRLLSSSRAEPSGRSHGKLAQARMPAFTHVVYPISSAPALLFTAVEGRWNQVAHQLQGMCR